MKALNKNTKGRLFLLYTSNELPQSIQRLAAQVRTILQDRPKLADMFEQCLSNTWNTTIKRNKDGTTFVITGDIPAMWLRDSAAQVRPFLILAAEDEEIADMMKDWLSSNLLLPRLILMQTHLTRRRMGVGIRMISRQ